MRFLFLFFKYKKNKNWANQFFICETLLIINKISKCLCCVCVVALNKNIIKNIMNINKINICVSCRACPCICCASTHDAGPMSAVMCVCVVCKLPSPYRRRHINSSQQKQLDLTCKSIAYFGHLFMRSTLRVFYTTTTTTTTLLFNIYWWVTTFFSLLCVCV